MALPPDPHEDDLSDPATADLAAASTPPPPPPPAPSADPGAPPPPPPPPPPPFDPGVETQASGLAAPAVTTPASEAVATPARPAPPGPPTVAAAPTPGAPAAVGGDPGFATAPEGARRGGPNRALLAVAGLVAAVAVVGGVLVFAGGGDDDETSAPSTEADDQDAAAPGAPADEADPSTDDTDATGGAPASGADDTPVVAAQELFAAARAGDCEAMVDRLAPEAFPDSETRADAVAECFADVEGRAEVARLEIVEISPVSESGDEAVVLVTATLDGETATRELSLRRVDGVWVAASLN